MREKQPDKKNARSMLEAANRDMRYTLSLEVSEDAAATIARNIYECFRMLENALLMGRGVVADDHIEQIRALLVLDVETSRPLGAIEKLRKLRHNVNYNGYTPTMAEVHDALDVANACFHPLSKQI
ncbi:MAG: hypothetical protein OXR66_06180 [Candidatus Woesearchaeota archaeon]|nr:hypothetical protein [Candidatus Woesearchaeota archaeon]